MIKFRQRSKWGREAAQRVSEVYRITRDLTWSYSKYSGTEKDKNGNKITSENPKLERWAEHFIQVLNRLEPTETSSVDENFRVQLERTWTTYEGRNQESI